MRNHIKFKSTFTILPVFQKLLAVHREERSPYCSPVHTLQWRHTHHTLPLPSTRQTYRLSMTWHHAGVLLQVVHITSQFKCEYPIDAHYIKCKTLFITFVRKLK